MRDEDLRGLRRLAEEQGDSASWSRLAAAHARLGNFDDAGEALVRARAVGVADPAVEDRLEEASLEDAIWRPIDGSDDSRLFSWAPDSKRLYFHSKGGESKSVAAAEAPSWAVRVVLSGKSAWVPAGPTGFAVDLEEQVFFATGRTSAGLGVFVLGDRSIPIPRDVHLPDGHFGGTEIAAWSSRVSLTAFALERPHGVVELKQSRITQDTQGVFEASLRSFAGSRLALCWNGDFAVVGTDSIELTRGTDGAEPEVVSSPSLEHVVLAHDARPSIPTLHAGRNYAEKADVLLRIRQLTGPLAGVAVSPGGRFVATFMPEEPVVEIVDLVAETARSFRTPTSPRHAVWAPCGRRLAIAMVEGLAIVELGSDPHAALDAQWRAVVEDDRYDDHAFFQKLETDPRPVVTEWLARQLEPEPDERSMPFRVASAARALARRRSTVDVARVREARAKLPTRAGGFRDYRSAVDHLIRVLEGMARGEKCACTAGFVRPADHGALERVSEDKRAGSTVFVYACRVCRRKFRVTEDTSYHFPTYEVKEIQE